jgi:hypothetical protein
MLHDGRTADASMMSMIGESWDKCVGATRVQNGVPVPLVHERPEKKSSDKTIKSTSAPLARYHWEIAIHCP